MERINIAEILRDCPKGMELDCINYDGVVTFEEISNCSDYPIKITVKYNNECVTHTLTKYGQTCISSYNKCIIFPKGKTTWEGFQMPFKDGDIIYLLTEHNNEYITIFKESVSDYLETHIDVVIVTSKCSLDSLFYVDNIKEQRLATEEEKTKLFKTIKDNGYKWNPETKVLEKLPKFKVGDRIQYNNESSIRIIKSLEEDRYRLDNGNYIKFGDEGWITKLPLKEPYFKIGDEIVKKNSISNSYIVSSVSCEYYGLKLPNNTGIGVLKVDEQDEWVLVSKKFDVTTLKPFDKVLVRDFDNETWEINFFAKLLDGKHFKCLDLSYVQCIPYEGNEHLYDTTNNCCKFYRTWES